MRTSTAAFMAGITAGSILIGGLTLYLGSSMSEPAGTTSPAATTEPFVMAGITTNDTGEPGTEPAPAPTPVTTPVTLDPLSAEYNPFL